MRRIERARIVGRVAADLGVGEIVHHVVRDVRDQDADDRERQPEPVDAVDRGVAAGRPIGNRREQQRDQTGEQRQRKDAGPGDDEPSGEAVDDTALGWVGGEECVSPGREALGEGKWGRGRRSARRFAGHGCQC